MKNTKYMLNLFLALFLFMGAYAQKPTEAQKEAMKQALTSAKNKVDPSAIPGKYAFSWKYRMEVKTEAGKSMNIDYFLEPNAAYYGANMNQTGSNMFMIMDTKSQLMVTSFEKSGKKMAMASKIPDYSGMTDPKNTKYTYKSLPSKVILGFTCKGIQATSAASTMVFYYTSEAKVSFAEIFKSQQNKGMAKAFEGFFKPGEKPLMMSMEYKDLKDKAKSVSMTCVALEKKAYVFNKSDYQFM
ncbi:hypothetical protein [Flavobacterium humi]|uniref:DUF4412 domain-containing protein n=1 Tax=Flavobacterium humi TaxID=2562683 RepID=A0A4Z0L941_9FLAO|nr:hypothetical protein [Flavobacterium humi]TGD57695.1 hypothetical protein E4635_10955 [Flavobacterium humi]